MGEGNVGAINPITEATNERRKKFEAAVSAEQARLGRKLTGRERSILWSKFAPHFYIQRPPTLPRQKAKEIGDELPDCTLEVA